MPHKNGDYAVNAKGGGGGVAWLECTDFIPPCHDLFHDETPTMMFV